eukprot:Blabericola_migrator_1__7587@NODE_387_length_9104_cov_64_864336_g310_i0_p5_GENE_NODE_387_length_9104_cov_64_864336_g310_i0NODE_387_length_9104_cov_64_864336_g310_i0_p5_ORF_typecomplete_len311_score41_96TPK_catalytic/PF04263_16/1_9e18TPK_B1_binding/PF04265_14/2_2e15_NODE_387_length_9104_cov_64_864336_g310_i057276659
MAPRLIDLTVLDELLDGPGRFHPQGEHEIALTCLEDGICDNPLLHTNIHVLLLNYDLMPGRNLLRVLRAAKSITCADGGANRLAARLREYDLPTINDVFYIQNTDIRKPCLIVGDLDSYIRGADLDPIRPAPDLEGLGFELIQIKDDYSTDFFKARTEIEKRGLLKDGDTLLVDGAFGGRFDQTVGVISSIYRYQNAAELPKKWGPCGRGETNINYNTILVGSESACCLVPPGRSILRPPKKTATKVCGLLPFIPVSNVRTRGLRWNLDKDPLAMNGICSSSNEVDDALVHIESDGPLIWYSCLKEFRLI